MRRIAAVFAVLLGLAACDLGGMTLQPPEGSIVDTETVVVTGELPPEAEPGGAVVVNDVAGTFTGSHTWTAEIPMSTVGYVTVVRAVYTEPDGGRYVQNSALINGPKVDDGERSPDGVGMRFTNTGLDGLGGVINDLAGSSFDISGLILAQQPLIPPTDAGLGVTITGSAYEAGSSGVSIDAGSTAGGVATHIAVNDLFIGLDLQLSGLISGACKLELNIPTTTIDATFDLAPDAADPAKVDVNLIGTPVVATEGVSYQFISGICDPSTPLLGSIIDSQAGSAIEGTVKDGFAGQLGDPDGAGPADSSIADAIETALAQISIAGSIGEATRANLDAPFTRIDEGADAIDFRADADFFSTFGTGPSDCVPPPGAPDVTSSYDVSGTYPTLGGTSPGGSPYGLGLVISSSAFNQLLSVMTECGLLNQDMTQIPLGGATLPVDSSVLAALVPEFGTKLPAGTPMLIRIDPQAAPFLTGRGVGAGRRDGRADARRPPRPVHPAAPGHADGTGQRGDLAVVGGRRPARLRPGLRRRRGRPGADHHAAAGVRGDGPGPLELDRHERGHRHGAVLEPVPVVRRRPELVVLGVPAARVPRPRPAGPRGGPPGQLVHPLLRPEPGPADPARERDGHRPQHGRLRHRLGHGRLREWRHRIREQVTANQVTVDFDAVIGADEANWNENEEATAHAGYRVGLDVVPAAGETWQLDLGHLVRGAHTGVGDGTGGGYRAQSNISQTVTGRYQVDGGAWQSFSINVGSDGNPGETTPWQGGPCECDFTEPFIGTSSAVLQGTAAQSVVVEFGFDLRAFSEARLSQLKQGRESAVRLGLNDSLANGFTAGEYPGLGSRNVVDDGHRATITLTTVG